MCAAIRANREGIVAAGNGGCGCGETKVGEEV